MNSDKLKKEELEKIKEIRSQLEIELNEILRKYENSLPYGREEMFFRVEHPHIYDLKVTTCFIDHCEEC